MMSTNPLWHPQAHMPTTESDRIVVVRGDGAHVETEDGRRLLDGTSGLWHANIGHGRASVAEAAARQMREIETYHTFGRFANRPALDFAERLVPLGPIPDAKVFWTSGGSDSVDLAGKLARAHWQNHGRPTKKIILSREKAYHGLHGFGTSIGGIEPFRQGYGSDSLIPETVRVSTNDLDGVRAAVERVGADQIAALFAEPIIGSGGVIAPSDGYLAGLQQLCRENDILFVVDEVITGFGRAGTLFACERYGLTPDMVLMAKGITSGYAPLGGVLIAPGVWEPFFRGDDAPTFRHGLTYSGHATACAVAGENLSILEREDLVRRSAEAEVVLRAALQPIADHDLVAEVRCDAGFLAGVRLVPDAPADAVCRETMANGVIIRTLIDNVLQICPPFVVQDDEIRQIAEVLAASLDAVAVHR